MTKDEMLETCSRRCRRSAGAWARNTDKFAPSAITTTAEQHYCEGWDAALETAWPLFMKFVAEWIEIRGDDCLSSEIADEWREQMA